MRDPLKRRFALAALVAPRFNPDHCCDNLQAVLDPVGQLLHQHGDTLMCDCVLAFQSRTLGDVFDRQQDLLYLVARAIDLARVEHHYAPAD
jgi:hypothetical protein